METTTLYRNIVIRFDEYGPGDSEYSWYDGKLVHGGIATLDRAKEQIDQFYPVPPCACCGKQVQPDTEEEICYAAFANTPDEPEMLALCQHCEETLPKHAEEDWPLIPAKTEEDTLTCHICGTTQPDTDAAIEAGWLPSFYVGETGPERGTPICAACILGKCDNSADDLPTLKPEFRHLVKE